MLQNYLESLVTCLVATRKKYTTSLFHEKEFLLATVRLCKACHWSVNMSDMLLVQQKHLIWSGKVQFWSGKVQFWSGKVQFWSGKVHNYILVILFSKIGPVRYSTAQEDQSTATSSLARARLESGTYFTVERFALVSSDCGLKFIRVVNWLRESVIIIMQFTLLATPANQQPPIILGNRNKRLYCKVPDSLFESLARTLCHICNLLYLLTAVMNHGRSGSGDCQKELNKS